MQQVGASQSVIYVRDIMTNPVHTVQMDDLVLTAKLLFDRKRFHHAVVLDQDRVVGVVSDRDILKAISPFLDRPLMVRSQDLSTLKRRIHQIMSRELVTIGSDNTVVEAVEKMLPERVSCLPVTDGDRSLLGILTIRDVVAWAVGTSDVT